MDQEEINALSPVYDEFEGHGNIRVMFVGDLHLSHAKPISRKDDYSKSMIEKIEQLVNLYKEAQCDLVLFSGDVWHTTKQPNNYLVDVLQVFSQFEGNAYTIVGNHDIVYARTDTVNKTPLGVLLASGYLKRLGALVCRDGEDVVLFQGLDYIEKDPRFPEPYTEAQRKVLVAHNYIYCQASNFDALDSFDSSDHMNSVWDLLLVGHDHSLLEKRIGNKLILNPGALSRGTLSIENRNRDVGIFLIDIPIGEGEIKHIFYKINVRSQEEIYSELTINRREVSKRMNEFVKSLATESFSEEGEIEVILESLCGGDKVMLRYIRGHLFHNGLIASI